MDDEVKIELDDGVDFEGKARKLKFVIRKMGAFSAEAWMIRAGLLLGAEVVQLQNKRDFGDLLAALCKVKYEDAKPLLDELLDCCLIEVEGVRKNVTPALHMVQLPTTLIRLRMEALKANFGFCRTPRSQAPPRSRLRSSLSCSKSNGKFRQRASDVRTNHYRAAGNACGT